MVVPTLIDTYALPPAPNICDQTLREVIATKTYSLAHVLMEPGRSSLPHFHESMVEIYLMLSGTGILAVRDHEGEVHAGAFCVIPPSTVHQLRNGPAPLEHLVITTPPFTPDDILMYEPVSPSRHIRHHAYQDLPVAMASDGATVYELLSADEQRTLGLELAIGVLPSGRKATPHSHLFTEELYYVLSGEGRAHLDGAAHAIRPGTAILLPAGVVHGLESFDEPLRVLCVSVPPYSNNDFLV